MAEPKQLDLPAGFRAAAVMAGIKPSGTPDLAVLVADRDCAAAGPFPTNRVCAAPVRRGLKGICRNSDSFAACVASCWRMRGSRASSKCASAVSPMTSSAVAAKSARPRRRRA